MRLLTRRRSTFVVGFVSLAASAGCSLIADLSQFNGYGAADGSAPGVDSSSGDEQGQGDDTSPDQASSNDGPTHDGEAGATGDGPVIDAPNPLGTSWCSANFDDATLLCDDFDEGRADQFLTYPYGAVWSINQAGGTDGINRVDYAPGSAPFSMEVITACSTGTDGCQSAASQDQFTATVTAPSGVILSFALKIEDFDVTAGDVSLVTVGNGNFGGGGWRLSLDYMGGAGSSQNTFFEYFTFDGGADSYNKTLIEFPDFTDPCLSAGDGGVPDAGDGGICVGGWVTIQIMADYIGTSAVCATTGGPCATITYNGQSAILGGGSVIAITPPSMPTTQVLLGANYIQTSAQAMHLQYDNIKVEALP
jgi:hypothetical protein